MKAGWPHWEITSIIVSGLLLIHNLKAGIEMTQPLVGVHDLIVLCHAGMAQLQILTYRQFISLFG